MAVFQRTSCCHFRIFQKVAAKSVLNRWFIENYAPLESSTATAYTGVSRTYPAVERYLIHLGKSERYSLHNPANQRNPERDKEEIPLESEEL